MKLAPLPAPPLRASVLTGHTVHTAQSCAPQDGGKWLCKRFFGHVANFAWLSESRGMVISFGECSTQFLQGRLSVSVRREGEK